MALETLKGVKELGGFKVLQERPQLPDGTINWYEFDELRKTSPIYVDHDVNMISFRIQDGPIKENGVNGCQVDTLIHAARKIVFEFNEKFPCEENDEVLCHLGEAIVCLNNRTKNREARGVGGTSQL